MKILFLNWAPIVKYGMGPGFAQLGHDVEFIDPAEDNLAGILSHIDRFKPDLLFTEGGIGRESYILPAIEQSGIPHLYWAIEDPVAYNLSLAYGRKSILTLTTCVEWIDEIYTPNQVKAICIPFACNPDWHKERTPHPSLRHELVFMGNNYEAHGYRKEGYETMFRPFLDQSSDIMFYGGREWMDPSFTFHLPESLYGGYLAYESLPALCASADFILGVHSINGSKSMQSMRTFEVLGSKGFFFTHHSTAIEAMFENHEHLIWSSSPEETWELYTFYQKRPELREKIRRQGQQFVYEHHTYKQRAKEILARLSELV